MNGRLQQSCDSEIQRIVHFIDDQRQLAAEYRTALRERVVDLGFNIFAIVSGIYHRENLHSDILRVFLDPGGPHKEGSKYLDLFLKFLALHGAQCESEDYRDVAVTRESERIDLLIKGNGSAIIIENKVNGAVDQREQLPTYLKRVQALGCDCDAIIYLRLNGYAQPDTTGWKPEDRSEVNSLLKLVNAYDASDHDLYTWIMKCAKASDKPEARFILEQYAALLKKLGGNTMNKPVMKQFYETLQNPQSFSTAMSLRDMLNDLVEYRRDQIIERFNGKSAPFNHVIASARDLVQFYVERQDGVRIDIEVREECYRFYFWVNHPKGARSSEPTAESVLRKMQRIEKFSETNDEHSRWELREAFQFPLQEDELYKYLVEFNRKLNEVIAQDQGGR